MSSTRQLPAMSAEVRMRNARAANRERLRNQVLAVNPRLDERAVEDEVERLLFEQRSSGGRKGAERTAARHAAVREILAATPQMVALVEAHLDQLRKLATLAEDVA